MLPDGPEGAVAVICVAEFTEKTAETPPIITDVAPVRFVPRMVIVVPAVADTGKNEEIVGAGINVKPAKESLLFAVKTFTKPLAPPATVADILWAEFTVKVDAGTFPKKTDTTFVKF